jgi:hypothetical protein
MIGTPSEVILRSILTLRKTLTDQEYRLFATALSLLIRGLPPGELEVVCGAAASEIRRHRPVPVWRTASQDVQLKMKRTIDDLINRHKMDPVPVLPAQSN